MQKESNCSFKYCSNGKATWYKSCFRRCWNCRASRVLRFIGCDMAQGFLFARPMPIEEYEN